MSNSKPLPPFTCDLLCYLNRDQLERFSIICRLLKNLIKRYFHSKPYHVFDRLEIRRGMYALRHNFVHWHPNRQDYNVQQFLAGQRLNVDHIYYSFAEMRPYLGPTIRIKRIFIFVDGISTYNPEQIESIAYLWHDGNIHIQRALEYGNRRISAEHLQPILNSILQCRLLEMDNPHFSFKDYKVLYKVKVIETWYVNRDVNLDSWLQFLEQPGVKPLVVLCNVHRKNITDVLDRLCKAFSSAVLPNAFKITFTYCLKPLTEFREENNISGEKLELKKGISNVECQQYFDSNYSYTLERSSTGR